MELERGRRGQEEGPVEELLTVVRTSMVHGGMVLISNLDNSWGSRMVGWLPTQAPESEGLCLFPR